MFCPCCKDSTLQMSERNGIEIDYCGTCRGVWLDRGELDKIIEKSTQQAVAQSNYSPHDKAPEFFKDRHTDYKYKRKKSFLEEIFD